MEIREMQQEVDRWIGQFEEGYWHFLSMLARLTEEVGELAREVNHRYGQKPKKPGEPPGDLALELADILFIIVCYANSLGIDLEDAFGRMMEKYRQRDSNRWTRKKKLTPFPMPGAVDPDPVNTRMGNGILNKECEQFWLALIPYRGCAMPPDSVP